MSDREKLPELIDRYNNRDLAGDELATFLEMLRKNPKLREEVRLDNELNEILANEDIIELRQKIISVQKRHEKKYGPDLHFFLLAASLLLLIGMEILLFMNNARHPHSGDAIRVPAHRPESRQLPLNGKGKQSLHAPGIINGKDTAAERKSPAMLAAAFRKNPSFENMIGSTRNAGYFRMLEPAAGFRFGKKDKITFKWTADGSAGIVIRIMDNTGKRIRESGLLGDNKFSLPAGLLKDGLYYFEVLQKDEILFFGKFIVK